MPKPRGTEVSQRQSPRGPLQLRTSSSDSDSSHHRPIPEKSPKIGDRCSPQSVQSEPVNQKKLGTRIADLESQLGQAQLELKHLKKQLVTAEVAKKEVQEELQQKAVKRRNVMGHRRGPKETDLPSKSRTRSSISEDITDEIQQETDVFEVPMEEKITVEPENKTIKDQETLEIAEPERQPLSEMALKDEEINLLKGKLEEKKKEIDEVKKVSECLKKKIEEANDAIASAKSREDGMSQRLKEAEEQLKESRENSEKLKEKLEAVEGAKEALEAEMKMMRVQTEQWKKAADAAAAVLASGPELNNGRIPERCRSMDKHLEPMFEIPGYTFVRSPGNGEEVDDGFRGRRKGSGIRVFGDLWKKKGHK